MYSELGSDYPIGLGRGSERRLYLFSIFLQTTFHLLGAVHLLHGRARHLDGEELEDLVADVEWQVEHHVPAAIDMFRGFALLSVILGFVSHGVNHSRLFQGLFVYF